MIISLALLGYGASGTLLVLFGDRFQRHFHQAWTALAAAFATCMVLAYWLVGQLPFNPLELLWDPWQWLWLAATYLLLMLPFLLVALLICISFKRYAGFIGAVYGADLLGAGVGALTVMGMLHWLFPEQLLPVLASLAFVAAALGAVVLQQRRAAWLSATASLGLLVPALQGVPLDPNPFKPLQQQLQVMGSRVIAERSSPLARLTVVASPEVPLRHVPGMSLNTPQSPPEQLALFSDGDAMTAITRFGGNPADLAYLSYLPEASAWELLPTGSRVLILGAGTGMPVLAQKRVVYVGETHTRYGHHLLQLEIIKGLHAQDWDFAIGMEFFQQPYQWVLDAFVRGELSENEMLRKSQWYQRWQYDYRLYRPIPQFARQHRIPVIALNVPKELIGKISDKGYAGLSAKERARLPQEIDTSDQTYHSRLQEVFKQHSGMDEKGFERFKEVQLTWDEGIAQAVADYLQNHPDKKMVVLAGAGHLRYGSGIPNRVNRRIPVDCAIVLPSNTLETTPGLADYVVVPVDEKLPAKGLMGFLIDARKEGVVVSGVIEGSAAEKAGIRKGDIVLRIDDQPIASLPDVRINMLDKRPGDPLRLQILRGQERLELDLVLGGGE